MIKTLFLLLLATLLCANPKIYSALGDVIYDNVHKIEKLKNISNFQEYESKIDEYVKSVYLAKEVGYSIEMGNPEIDKMKYLETLRELSKTNDIFYRQAQSLYRVSIEKENTFLWNQIINSGLIDVQSHKEEILEFYFAHADEINEQGVIEKFLDEDEKLKAKNTYKSYSPLLKRDAQEDKIKRIREKDKAKQEAIQKSLEEELIKNKTQIRDTQEKELIKPS